jgi:iron complex transport system ATP-binding protein
MSVLALSNACVSRQNVAILKDVSFSVSAGKMVGLLGPNGAGKTTAVRALLGLQGLSHGAATIDGRDTNTLTAQERARAVSYLPQARTLAWPISVREAVALGRFAFGGPLGRPSAHDQAAVSEAITQCDLNHLATRSVSALSGGELARVHIARALASGTRALIADEPTNALDPRHGIDILSRLQIQAKNGAAVLVILHDLVSAARYCDEIILLDKGLVVAQGTPSEVLTPENLEQVYRIKAHWQDGDLKIFGAA